MSAWPVSKSFPNGVKLSGPRRSLSGAMVKGVPSGCDKYSSLRDVSTCSISSGLVIVVHCSGESDGGMLFQLSLIHISEPTRR